MKEANFESYHIRRWFCHEDESLFQEAGQKDDGAPIRRIVIAAAIQNPYAHTFSTDLSKIIDDSPKLGVEFGRRLNIALRGEAAQSYGKACLVGSAGEFEHGKAFLTTDFANPVREALGGGKSWIPSTGKRAAFNEGIDVPLACKDALYVRSHYDSVYVSFADVPAPDEVVVIFAVATRGRFLARCGGLKFDEISEHNGLR